MKPSKSPNWKDIHGYEGLYEISISGIVRSLGRCINNRQVKPTVLKHRIRNGYHEVALYKEGKYRYLLVHRLVLTTFGSPAFDDTYQCAHLDGCRDNNCISNLQWVTPKENAHHRDIHGTTVRGTRHWTHQRSNNPDESISAGGSS